MEVAEAVERVEPDEAAEAEGEEAEESDEADEAVFTSADVVVEDALVSAVVEAEAEPSEAAATILSFFEDTAVTADLLAVLPLAA